MCFLMRCNRYCPCTVGDDGEGYLLMVLSFMKFLASGARLAALPVALAAAFPSFAQTQLKDVVVTANRSEQLLTEAIPHTTVIGRDVIERSQAIDLPSLLSSEAGFQFTQNGGRGTSANLFLRGSASIQVLVLIEPLTEGAQVSTLFSGFPHLTEL